MIQAQPGCQRGVCCSKGSATLHVAGRSVPCLGDPASSPLLSPSTPTWVSWPCQSLVFLLFKMHSRSPCSSLCSGLKLLHSNFFFHFISGRALQLCSLLFHPPLLLLSFSLAQPPSLLSPPAPSSYLTPIFSVLSPSVLLPRGQLTNHKLCSSSNSS